MTLTTLQADARFLVFGDSSNTQYADTDLNRALNRFYRQGVAIVLATANNDFRVAGDTVTANITAATNYVALDSTLIKVKRVDIKYPSSADYRQAKEISFQKPMAVGFDKYVAGTNPEYCLFDGNLYFFVGDVAASILAVTSGIKYYFYDDVTDLSSGTDVPALSPLFHSYLSTGAAFVYCRAHKMNVEAREFERDLAVIEQKLRETYARLVEGNRSLSVKREDYGQMQFGR
jgi:hypothetical protein